MIKDLEKLPWRRGRVALVGNASSLRDTDYGAAIDSADCVVRINQGAFVPLDATSTGQRTDAVLITLNGNAMEKAWMYAKCRRVAQTVVAMSPKKRTVLGRDLGTFISVYPQEWHQKLHTTLGARPSTGAMAIDLLARTVETADNIYVYGFDFWGSPTTYTGIAQAAPHDPVAEENYVLRVVGLDRVHR